MEMDPLSLTTETAELATSLLQRIARAEGNTRLSGKTINNIDTDLEIVQGALRRICSDLKDPGIISRLELDDVFRRVVEGCRVTLERIRDEIEGFFTQRDRRAAIPDARQRGGELRSLMERLEKTKASLRLLADSLKLGSAEEVRHLLGRPGSRKVLGDVGYVAALMRHPDVETNTFGVTNQRGYADEMVLGSRESQVFNTRLVRRGARADLQEYPLSDGESCSSGSTIDIAPSQIYRRSFSDLHSERRAFKGGFEDRNRDERPRRRNSGLLRNRDFIAAGIGALAAAGIGYLLVERGRRREDRRRESRERR